MKNTLKNLQNNIGKIVAVIAIALLIIIGFISGINKQEISTDTIQLGAVLSLSGNASYDGESIKQGIDLAVLDLAKNGIGVEVLYEDDNTDPKNTISTIQKIAKSGDIKIILGPTWSHLASASAGTLAQKNIITLQPANTSEFVDAGESNMFFASLKNAKKETPLTDLVAELGAKRAVIIIDENAWGQSHLEPFRNAMANNNGTVILEEALLYGSESTTISTILAQAKELEADIILWTGYDKSASILIQKYTELEMNIPMVGEPTLAHGERYELAQSAEAGIYVMDTTISNEFAKKYRSHYGQEPSNYSDIAYDNLMMAVEAIQNTDGSSDEVANYLENEISYEGFANTYEFDESGDIAGGEWLIKKVN